MESKKKPPHPMKLGPCPWCQSKECQVHGGGAVHQKGCQWECKMCHARGPVAHRFNTPKQYYLAWTAADRFWKVFPPPAPAKQRFKPLLWRWALTALTLVLAGHEAYKGVAPGAMFFGFLAGGLFLGTALESLGRLREPDPKQKNDS